MTPSTETTKLGTGWWLGAVAAALVGLGSAWWLAQPDRSLDPATRLAAEIGCQCGTCPHRPIATCGCGFADGMLAELQEMVDAGMGDEEILTTFASRYDESVRIRPRAGGWSLAAWAVPLMLLSVGAVLLAGVVSRWAGGRAHTATAAAAPEAEADAAPPDADAAALRARLERELERLDS